MRITVLITFNANRLSYKIFCNTLGDTTSNIKFVNLTLTSTVQGDVMHVSRSKLDGLRTRCLYDVYSNYYAMILNY